MSTGSPTTGSGRGGGLGTPSHLPEEEPPSQDQDANFVVSGGGVASVEDDEEPGPKRKEPGPGGPSS